MGVLTRPIKITQYFFYSKSKISYKGLIVMIFRIYLVAYKKCTRCPYFILLQLLKLIGDFFSKDVLTAKAKEKKLK